MFVWDVRRTSSPLARLPASSVGPRAAQLPACRSVKFTTAGPLDLLVFSEHTSNVHVVDARTFTQQQVIDVARDCNKAGSGVAGLAFADKGRTLVVALEERLAQYEIDSLTRRTFTVGAWR